ncbi:LEA type 2 family protein [Pseudomonas sp. 3A(2025)]
MLRHIARLLLVTLPLLLGACALLPDRDALLIDVVGIEPLPGQGLEVRMAVKLRVQNPNDTAIEYNGVALRLEVNARLLAAGVSDQPGSVGRFGETLLVVPVSISAFSALRQALGLAQGQQIDSLPYTLHGKLAGGLFGTQRFRSSGTLSLPGSGSRNGSGSW